MPDGDTFRHVIGHFASGVTVLTARHAGEDFGATANAVSSLSLDPPMLLVCLNRRSTTQEAIHASGRFGVNILDENQGVLAERFAAPRGRDKFAGLAVARGVGDVPLLTGSLAHCDCRVTESVTAGTHRVFLADVIGAAAHEGSPLTYFRGAFGRFEVERDRAIYGELRDRIVDRVIPLAESLDVGALAVQLDTLPGTVYHAVTQLVADGLLTRDPLRGYVVTPVTARSSDEAFDARCTIELGVVASTVGSVAPDRLAGLRTLVGQIDTFLVDGEIVDADAYARHNEAFHHALVGLTENPTLLEAYRRLGVTGLMGSLLGEGSALLDGAGAGAEIIREHRAIVAAFESGDRDATMDLIRQHNGHAKQAARRAIVAARGEL